MKYGYEITIGLLDSHQDIALCVIKNIKDFDTMTESNQTMEHLALKLNIEHPLYIKSKNIITKQEYYDPLVNINNERLEPEFERIFTGIMEKMVKEHGRSND